jgi:MFS family permease
LDILWRRNLPLLIAVSLVIGFGFGVYLGDWSFIRSPAYFWRNIIYMTLTLGGYFAMIIGPMVAGTIAGYFLRKGICRK